MAEVISRRSIIYDILFDVSQGKKGIAEAERALEKATATGQGFNNILNQFGKTLSGRQLKGGINDLKQGITLLGLENQALTSGILKTQGAISLLKAGQTALNLVVGKSTGILKGFRIALAATGVGLAVIAIAALVENWDKLKDAITKTNTELQKNRQRNLENLESQIKLAEALGKETFELEVKRIKTELSQLFADTKISAEERNKRQKELITELDILNIKNEEEKKKRIEQNELAIKEATILIFQEGTKERLQAELNYINAKEKFEIESAKGNQAQINLIYFKAQQERQKLIDEFNRANRPKEAKIVLDSVNETFIEQQKIIFDLTDALQKYYDILANPPSVEKTDESKIRDENIEKAIANLEAAKELTSSIEELSKINQRNYEADAQALEQALSDKLITQEQYNKGIEQLNRDKARADLTFTLAEIAINSGLAIANIVKSATSSSITPIEAIAQIVAGIAAVLSGISQAYQAVTAAGFEEGTEYLERGSHKKGVDTIPIMANEGEAIIPTDKNAKYKGLSAAMINDDVDRWVRKNYIDPNLAVTAMDSAIKDSRTIDYSNRFYRQFIATQEGNYNSKKMTSYLASIDSKLSETKYAKWYGRT